MSMTHDEVQALAEDAVGALRELPALAASLFAIGEADLATQAANLYAEIRAELEAKGVRLPEDL